MSLRCPLVSGVSVSFPASNAPPIEDQYLGAVEKYSVGGSDGSIIACQPGGPAVHGTDGKNRPELRWNTGRPFHGTDIEAPRASGRLRGATVPGPCEVRVKTAG